MRVSLTFSEGALAGQTREVQVSADRAAMIGRGPHCDLMLGESDRTASSSHAKLWLDGKDLYVTDIGSQYGLYVNDKAQSKARLLQNDKLRFGFKGPVATITFSDRPEPLPLQPQRRVIKKKRPVAMTTVRSVPTGIGEGSGGHVAPGGAAAPRSDASGGAAAPGAPATAGSGAHAAPTPADTAGLDMAFGATRRGGSGGFARPSAVDAPPPAYLISAPGAEGAGGTAPEADEWKRCPFCAESIRAQAVKCRFCGEFMPGASPPVAPSSGGFAPPATPIDSAASGAVAVPAAPAHPAPPPAAAAPDAPSAEVDTAVTPSASAYVVEVEDELALTPPPPPIPLPPPAVDERAEPLADSLVEPAAEAVEEIADAQAADGALIDRLAAEGRTPEEILAALEALEGGEVAGVTEVAGGAGGADVAEVAAPPSPAEASVRVVEDGEAPAPGSGHTVVAMPSFDDDDDDDDVVQAL